jgi:hypothetical protein
LIGWAFLALERV